MIGIQNEEKGLMTMHHLVKEETIESMCIYCGDKLSNKRWISEFDFLRHYKTVLCKCGVKNWIRKGFISSGHEHDNWKPNGKLISGTIEEKM
ncbi:hypothetical protein HQ529_02085 [Candidatus Woesearchaeota archaeon]|nr:hypothetical protein [Candidatus Woesearchaeota archaeon]